MLKWSGGVTLLAMYKDNYFSTSTRMACLGCLSEKDDVDNHEANMLRTQTEELRAC